MTTATFQTARGADISLAIKTEQPNIADHNFTAPCYELELRINGERVFGGVERKDDPTHGPVIHATMAKKIIPIPADKVAEVDALMGEYKAEIERRGNAQRAADEAYERHHDYIEGQR